jgi:murein DD-endopeptidase MepM/ murein hydrolase activator NlpD
MATQCTLAPFINQEFYITGTWGEQRPTHLHAGLDLATGSQNNVYNMKEGYAIHVDGQGTDGSGYGPNIIIQSLDGTTWLYGDLSPFSGINQGDLVTQGQYIAQEGNPAGTGSTGLHVHVELELLNYGDSFRYGYANSSDPCIPLGLPNQTGGPYIYNGTPTPPTPGQIISSKFKWVLYAKKLRKRRIKR